MVMVMVMVMVMMGMVIMVTLTPSAFPRMASLQDALVIKNAASVKSSGSL